MTTFLQALGIMAIAHGMFRDVWPPVIVGALFLLLANEWSDWWRS